MSHQPSTRWTPVALASALGARAVLLASALWLLCNSAVAAPTCPSDADVLSIEGIGAIYSSGGYEIADGSSTFNQACLERDGWLIRFAVLTVVGNGEAAILSADSASFETDGATAQVTGVNGTVNQLDFGAVTLNLSSRYAVAALPRGDYTARATSGTLSAARLRLVTVVLDRLRDAKPIERYSAATLELSGSSATLSALRYQTDSFAVSATTGLSFGPALSVTKLSGIVGRNASGSELSFSADSALRLPSGAFVLEGASVALFGLSVPLGRVTYDPNCPLELPLVFSPGLGLTIGVDQLRLSCDFEARVTLIGHDLFSASTGFTGFLTARQGTASLFVGQRRNQTASANLSSLPEIGFGAQFILDSGQNLEQTLNTERFLELRGQVSTVLDGFGLRFTPRLELGASAQSRSSSPDALLPFARGYVGIASGWGLGALQFSTALTSSYTMYGDGSSAANGTGRLALDLTLEGLSAGVALRYQQQFAIAPIVRHNLSDLTRLDANLRFSPRIDAPPLGYAGLRLEQPVFALILEYDLRAAAFVKQRVEIGARGAWYDGVVLTDHFGNAFQTPKFSLALSANYDFNPQAGELGGVFSLYGQALVYNFGVFIALPTARPRFSFSLGLR